MKYKEIFKLKEMLEKAGIPFEWQEYWGYSEEELKELKKIAPDLVEHYQICYPCFGDGRWISVIEGFGTYGSEQDKLEIMGGFTKPDDEVIGYMTAIDVFNRIKAHFRKGKFIMKKTIKVIDEDTLEIKEIAVEEKITEEDADSEIVQAFQTALNCDPEKFYTLYRDYKKAEKAFNTVYEPFKERLIALHDKIPDLPKRAIIENLQLTYVSPSTRTSIDSKKLKEEEPDIAKKYTKTSNVKASVRLEEVWEIDDEKEEIK